MTKDHLSDQYFPCNETTYTVSTVNTHGRLEFMGKAWGWVLTWRSRISTPKPIGSPKMGGGCLLGQYRWGQYRCVHYMNCCINKRKHNGKSPPSGMAHDTSAGIILHSFHTKLLWVISINACQLKHTHWLKYIMEKKSLGTCSKNNCLIANQKSWKWPKRYIIIGL